MTNEELLILETRRKIYDFIHKHPGIHVRELSRSLKIPKTTLCYHLNFLKKEELISEDSSKRYLRYYVSNKVGIDNKTVLNFLRYETTRNMIILFLHNIVASRSELSNSLNKHPTTIAFHLKRLQDEDIIELAPMGKGFVYRKGETRIIERTITGREILFRLKNPKIVYDTLIKHKQSLLDKNSKLIIEECKKRVDEGIKSHYKSMDTAIDELIDEFFDMFPNPYHI